MEIMKEKEELGLHKNTPEFPDEPYRAKYFITL